MSDVLGCNNVEHKASDCRFFVLDFDGYFVVARQAPGRQFAFYGQSWTPDIRLAAFFLSRDDADAHVKRCESGKPWPLAQS